MFRSIIIAASLTASFLGASVYQAHAQEAPKACTVFADAAACSTSGWCRWSDRKAVTLPSGQTVQPKGSCAFKPGLKAVAAEQVAAKK